MHILAIIERHHHHRSLFFKQATSILRWCQKHKFSEEAHNVVKEVWLDAKESINIILQKIEGK